MSKYEDEYSYQRESIPLMEGEQVLWKGKPKKVAYILGQATQGIAVVALWLVFDLFFIFQIVVNGDKSNLSFIIIFFIMHLMPVWIWLKNTLTASKRWKNTIYYVTDKRIIIGDGFFAENCHTIYYKDILGVNLHVGLLDKLFKTGDVMLVLNYQVQDNSKNGNKNKGGFYDIEDFERVYKIVQKTVLDVQTDMEYPNEYRPSSNPGYGTRYNP